MARLTKKEKRGDSSSEIQALMRIPRVLYLEFINTAKTTAERTEKMKHNLLPPHSNATQHKKIMLRYIEKAVKAREEMRQDS